MEAALAGESQREALDFMEELVVRGDPHWLVRVAQDGPPVYHAAARWQTGKFAVFYAARRAQSAPGWSPR